MIKERKNIFICFILAIAAGFAITVWLMPSPHGAPWAPKCWWLALTGTRCPGCGTTRAIYALCHGEPARAWSLNPFFFTATPLALACVWLWLRRPSSKWLLPLTVAYASIFALWWMVRNILGI